MRKFPSERNAKSTLQSSTKHASEWSRKLATQSATTATSESTRNSASEPTTHPSKSQVETPCQRPLQCSCQIQGETSCQSPPQCPAQSQVGNACDIPLKMPPLTEPEILAGSPRKWEGDREIIVYVHGVLPMKRSRQNTMNYCNLELQSNSEVKPVVCFSRSKCSLIVGRAETKTAVKLEKFNLSKGPRAK